MVTIAEALDTAAKLHDAGNLPEAEARYAEVLKADPRQARAWHGMGLIAHTRGDAVRAVECLGRAILLDGARAEYHNHLGAALHTQAKLADAMASYRRALQLSPDYADAHCNLGSAYKDQGEQSEAIACYLRALELKPNLAEAHFNLGVLHQNQARTAEAISCYERAVGARPDYWQSYNNLGTVYKLAGRFDEALACYERALACQGDVAEAHRNRALLRLLLGNYAEGWPEYEWRWQVAGAVRPNVSQPRWQGEPFAGGTVLLKAEQGLGDAIQFVRYAPLVKERSGAKVIMQCPAALRALLTHVRGVDGFAADPWEQAAFDAYVPLLSLPAVFKTRLETIPHDVPYLEADAARVARWRTFLAARDGFKVGIAWQGNPGYAGDVTRSILLEQFVPLADCPAVRLFSLQKVHGCDQLAALGGRISIESFGPAFDAEASFVDTAAAMMSLDLVITSDTAIAHLAGALGVPVWVALQRVPDWRWLLERDDSPWYPTMRLFRQQQAGDWQGVFASIAQELRSLSASARVG